MLVDKLNTDTERAEVEMECVEVKAANDQTSQVSLITNEDFNCTEGPYIFSWLVMISNSVNEFFVAV